MKKKNSALQIFKDELSMGIAACGATRGFRAYMSGETACRILEEHMRDMGMDIDIILVPEAEDDSILMAQK